MISRLQNQACESTQLLVTSVFCSFIIISQLGQPVELKFSQVCYFMHMLRYTIVRRLVFDNYQQCALSLIDVLSHFVLLYVSFNTRFSLRLLMNLLLLLLLLLWLFCFTFFFKFLPVVCVSCCLLLLL